MKSWKANLILLGLGLILEGLFLTLGYHLSTHLRDIVPFVILCLVAFGVYSVALFLVPSIRPNRWTVPLVLLLSLLFRTTLVPVKGDPFLPDADIYRYLWDGQVAASGMNPYRFAPGEIDEFLKNSDRGAENKNSALGGAGEFETLRELSRLSGEPPFDQIFPSIRYREVKTIYPPLAQCVFALAAWIRPGGFICLKLFLFGFEVLTLFFISLMLRRLGKNPLWVMVYGWCPLVVEEFAYSGHHDATAVFFLTAACYLLLRRRSSASGCFLGLAIASKVFPAALLPIFLRRGGWKCVLAAMVAVVLLTLPFLGAGRNVFSGLHVFAKEWNFNAGLFTILEEMAGSRAARVLAGVVVAATSLWLMIRNRGSTERGLRDMLVVLVVLLLVSPVLNPWYVSWIVPLLCLFPSPLILLTGCVFLHYLYFHYSYLDTPVPGWLRPLEFGIFYLALALELARSHYARRQKNLGDHPGPQRAGGDSAGARGDPTGPGT